MTKPNLGYFLDKIFNNKPASTLLIVLLAVDMFFIVLHIILKLLDIEIPKLYVDTERGYPEMFQYLQLALIIILFLLQFSKSKSFGYIVWAFLFLYILYDDAFKFHEFKGWYFVEKFNLPSVFGLRPNDLGEIIVLSIVGVIFGSLLILSYYLSSKMYKIISRNLFLLLIILTFFGMVVDGLHQALDIPIIYGIMGVIEDGGEMVTLSFIMSYLYFIHCNRDSRLSFNRLFSRLFVRA